MSGDDTTTGLHDSPPEKLKTWKGFGKVPGNGAEQGADEAFKKPGNLAVAFGGKFNPDAYAGEVLREDQAPAIMRFAQELAAYGLLTSGQVIADEQIHRCKHKDDKKGRDSGWYVFYDGGLNPTGVYGSWKLSERHVWTSRNTQEMNSDEREEHARRTDTAKRQAEEARRQRQDEAAAYAYEVWKHAGPVKPDHPYLAAKGVKPLGDIKQRGDQLVLIATNPSGTIRSYQTIHWGIEQDHPEPHWIKKYCWGGGIQGCAFQISGNPARVYIVEGYATGCTVAAATGCMVLVAFDANNLTPVAEHAAAIHPNSHIILAGDNDEQAARERAANGGDPENKGVVAATKAAQKISGTAVFPTMPGGARGSDFNDLAALSGLDEVRRQLGVADGAPLWSDVQIQDMASKHMGQRLLAPPGVLGEIAMHYNLRAVIPQPGFAVQTAISCLSTLLGRRYKTSNGNYPTLYLVCVGKSSQGKENGKGTNEAIFHACGVPELIVGGGYTSAGAVFSALMRHPAHLAIIDELGMYLESGSSRVGNQNAMDANRILMEAIGRCGSVLRPTEYSTMTSAKAHDADRIIHHPAISILAMTTPSTFYDALTVKQIRSGFLGRFVIYQSFLPRAAPILREEIAVPDSIVSWADHIRMRHAGELGAIDPSQVEMRMNLRGPIARYVPNMPGYQIVLPISSGALELFRGYAQANVTLQDELEKDGTEALVGRYPEFSMRLALIVALSKDPYATMVSQSDADWAIEYMDFCGRQTVGAVNGQMVGSDHERARAEVLEAVRLAGGRGVTTQEMRRNRPFTTYDNLRLSGIVKELTEGRLIDARNVTAGKGRPRVAYVALDPRFSDE